MIDRLMLAIGSAGLGLAGTALGLEVAASPQPRSEPASFSPATASTAPSDEAARCSALAGSRLAGATVDRAEFVAGGATLAPFKDPFPIAFCRVDASVSPVPDSLIKIQVWLPADWNGKLVGTGGGGLNGGLASAPLSLRGPVGKGYAGVATDAGHDVSVQAEWALGHPEKIADFGHRANHLGAVFGKAVAAAYYGRPVKRAFFHGCSNGGRDALMLAQRHPADYDGIVAGAPANDWTGLLTAFMRNEQAMRLVPARDAFRPKMKLLHDAAIRQCDANDGARDGLIEQPSSCRFDPAVLQCKAGAGADCLSKTEVDAVRTIYRGTYTRDGRQIMAGFPVGSEYEWTNWIASQKGLAQDLGTQFYRYLVHGDRAWDVSRFELDRDHALARRRLGHVLDAVDPDLRPFVRRGGKLLMYHGWDDAAIPAGSTLRYHAELRRTLGRRAAGSTRLFMLPGVAHCAGGNGPDVVDYVAELDRWGESGVAPELLVATKYDSQFRAMAGLPAKAIRTRPICAWPKSARYNGSGSTDDAANFACR